VSIVGRAGWVPPLLVGVCVGICAEVAAGILLYAGNGLMRSVSTVLVVEAAALSVGLWAAPAPGPDLVERLRRRWLMCLIAFLGAALFGTSWSVVREFGDTAVGQGMGLAILAALPLYAAGSVLGGMSEVARSDARGAQTGPGAAAMTGAALGFAATGFLLPRAPLPSSLLVACLIMLSFAGMLYGAVLGRRPVALIKAERSTSAGDASVEDRRTAGEKISRRVLFEGGHARREIVIGVDAVVPWEVVVARALLPGPDVPWRVLVAGGGASALPRAVLREHPTATVVVLERLEAIVEFGREHFDTELAVGDAERTSVRVGNLDDLVDEVMDSYDLVVVDSAALASLGGARSLSRRSRAKLVDLVGVAGTLAWGPRPGPDSAVADGWSQVVLVRDVLGAEQSVQLWSATTPALERLDGFEIRNGGPPQT
jgi:hypothetical protein